MRSIGYGLLLVATTLAVAYADALKPGDTAPTVAAAGWINGDPPKVEDRKGKVMVVDFYSTD